MVVFEEDSPDLPALAPLSAGITGVHHLAFKLCVSIISFKQKQKSVQNTFI